MISRQIIQSVIVNIRYYRQNKLVILLSLIALGLMTISFLPNLLFISAPKKFDLIVTVFGGFDLFIYLMIPLLGIATLHHHLQNRSIKMIITRPCPIEVWIAGQFASAALVTILLHLLLAMVCTAMFLAWNVPFQSGFVLLSVKSIFQTAILFSVLFAATSVLHPVLSVVIALVGQEGGWRWFILVTAASSGLLAETRIEPFRRAFEYILTLVYFIVPSFAPFAKETSGLSASMRAGATELTAIGVTGAYAVVVALFAALFSSLVLRRRSLT